MLAILAGIKSFQLSLDKASWILRDLDALHDGLGAPLLPGTTAVTLSALVRNLQDYAMIWCQPHISEISGGSRVRWIEYKLQDEGWCHERIRRLRVELGTEGLYYASLLEVTNDRKSHDECSESVCVAYNVTNYNEYKQRHETLAFASAETRSVLMIPTAARAVSHTMWNR